MKAVRHCRSRSRGRGLSLVELVVCIALIGAVAALLVSTYAQLSNRSADPLVQRQALAVAESLLQEIMAQGTGGTDQSGVANASGPEPGESRSGSGVLFDHVDDYDGLTLNPITTAESVALPGLEAYTASVAVRTLALNNGGGTASQGWWVDVRITAPGGSVVLLSGWRAALTP